MRERLWYELGQVKHNHFYCTFLLVSQRQTLNLFNMIILTFSSAGVMGWAIWKDIPIVACVIIATISLLRLLSPHIVPSDKQIDKMDKVVDFYFDFYNQLEQLWIDHYNNRLTDEEMQAKFYILKNTEREINKSVNEIVKQTNKKLTAKTDIETRSYLKNNFNA